VSFPSPLISLCPQSAAPEKPPAVCRYLPSALLALFPGEEESLLAITHCASMTAQSASSDADQVNITCLRKHSRNKQHFAVAAVLAAVVCPCKCRAAQFSSHPSTSCDRSQQAPSVGEWGQEHCADLYSNRAGDSASRQIQGEIPGNTTV